MYIPEELLVTTNISVTKLAAMISIKIYYFLLSNCRYFEGVVKLGFGSSLVYL
jgi:hypothetical protein